MSTLPQSADEFSSWIIGFLPEPIQPYAGFVFALIVVVVGVLTFLQPILGLFKSPEATLATTGDPTLDALLTLDANGKLKGEERDQLKALLLSRLSGAAASDGKTSGDGTNMARDEAMDRILDAPASEDKTKRLTMLLTDPKQALADMMADAKSAQAYVDIGRLAAGLDSVQAETAFRRAIALEPDNLDAALELTVLIHNVQGFKFAVPEYEKLLARAEGTRPDIAARVLCKIAFADLYMDNVDAANQKAERAIHIADAIHDPVVKGFVYGEAADFYLQQNQLDKAEELLNEARVTLKSAPDRQIRLEAYNFLSLSQLNQTRGDYDQAKEASNQALVLAKQLNNKRLIGNVYNDLAAIAYALLDYDEALRYLDQAADLFKEIDGDSPENSIDIYYLYMRALIFQGQNKHEDALSFLRQTLEEGARSALLGQAVTDELQRLIEVSEAALRGETPADTPEANDEQNASSDDELKDFENWAEDEVRRQNADNPPPAFDLEARIRETKEALERGDFDPDAVPDIPYGDEDDLGNAASAYVEAQSLMDDGKFEAALEKAAQSRFLFERAEALTPESEDDLDKIVTACKKALGRL